MAQLPSDSDNEKLNGKESKDDTKESSHDDQSTTEDANKSSEELDVEVELPEITPSLKKDLKKDKKSDKSETNDVSEELNRSEELEESQEIEVSQKEDEISKEPSLWEHVRFTFPQPRVIFGKGVIELLPKAIFELLDPMLPLIKKSNLESPKALIVIGGESVMKYGKLDRCLEVCEQNAIKTVIYSCGSGEATVEMVDQGVELARYEEPHYVVGVGGGSVLDVAKAIAGIYTNGGTVHDYHNGKPFELPGLPFIAIPTTAGTGSEITGNSVLIDKEHCFKKSIRGDQIISKYILLDPELTLSCTPEITASSGVDALVQAIEAYTSKRSHPLADLYAMQAINLLSQNLIRAFEHGDNYDSRSEMLLGSHFAGIAFANVGLGLVHGLAHPIGFKYGIPHGICCGALMPSVIEYNLKERASKYAKIAQNLGGLDFFSKYEPDADDEENARRLAAMIRELFLEVHVPIRLQDLGVKKEDFEWIVDNTKGGSVDTNPRTPDRESLLELLEKAW